MNDVARFSRGAAATVLSGLLLLALLPAAALLFGWRSTIVTSGSMTPAVRPGDIVLIDPVGARAASPGSIIQIHRDDGRPVVHRVVTVAPDGTLQTKGDANRIIDPAPVAAADVIGRARAVVPYVGRLRLLGTPYWRDAIGLLLVVVGCLAVFGLVPAGSGPAPGRSRAARPAAGAHRRTGAGSRRPWRAGSRRYHRGPGPAADVAVRPGISLRGAR